MNDIYGYIIINRKTKLVTNVFVFVSILIIASLIIVSQFKYVKYYRTYGQVINDSNKYQLALYLNPYYLNVIKSNNNLKIDNINYEYKISYIGSEYVISNNCNNCLMVVLDIDLKNEDKIINNMLNIEVLESDKKLFCYVKYYFLKGVNK